MPLRRSSRRRGRRLVWWCVAIGLLGIGGYALHVPLLTWVGQQLVHRDALVRSDALLVLAGGVFDRELEAAELFTQGMAPRVLMTAEPDPDVFGEELVKPTYRAVDRIAVVAAVFTAHLPGD